MCYPHSSRALLLLPALSLSLSPSLSLSLSLSLSVLFSFSLLFPRVRAFFCSLFLSLDICIYM